MQVGVNLSSLLCAAAFETVTRQHQLRTSTVASYCKRIVFKSIIWTIQSLML